MYIYMNILNGDGFYGHYIFYRLLPIDLHEISHYYHFKVLNALRLLRFLPCTVAWSVLYVSPHCFYVLGIIHALSEMTK